MCVWVSIAQNLSLYRLPYHLLRNIIGNNINHRGVDAISWQPLVYLCITLEISMYVFLNLKIIYLYLLFSFLTLSTFKLNRILCWCNLEVQLGFSLIFSSQDLLNISNLFWPFYAFLEFHLFSWLMAK